MMAQNKDYQNALLEIVSLIKDKAVYLKFTPVDSNFNQDHFNGMTLAYHFILDGIRSYVESHDEITLEEIGLEDFNPDEILKYKPLSQGPQSEV